MAHFFFAVKRAATRVVFSAFKLSSSRVLRTRHAIAGSIIIIGHVDCDGRFTTHATLGSGSCSIPAMIQLDIDRIFSGWLGVPQGQVSEPVVLAHVGLEVKNC